MISRKRKEEAFDQHSLNLLAKIVVKAQKAKFKRQKRIEKTL